LVKLNLRLVREFGFQDDSAKFGDITFGKKKYLHPMKSQKIPPLSLSDLTDAELLRESRKLNSIKITNAFLIGFLIGIVTHNILKNGLGFFTLISLFLAYKLINGSKFDKEELDRLLKKRKLRLFDWISLIPFQLNSLWRGCFNSVFRLPKIH